MDEPRAAEPVFLTSRQVADLLRVPLRTVEDWRLTRKGPPWLKLGRHVRYEQAELLAWVREHQHG
jgi:excisionase family DNA binding protein